MTPVTTPAGINITLMLKNHLPSEARELRAEIAALEAKTTEKRALLVQHQHLALVMGVDLDAPVAEPKPASPIIPAPPLMADAVAEEGEL